MLGKDGRISAGMGQLLHVHVGPQYVIALCVSLLAAFLCGVVSLISGAAYVFAAALPLCILFGWLLASGIATDTTDREEAEIYRRRLELQLQQAQKIEALVTMASGVRHEINNPLNGILNYAQLIKEESGEQGEDVSEFADEITRETERVIKIMGGFLALCRYGGDQPETLAEPYEMLEHLLPLIGPIMRRHQIALEIDVPRGLPAVRCHVQQIQQVVMNLLINARDALNAKYPSNHRDKILRLSVCKHSSRNESGNSEEASVRITVEDHGAGIPEEIRDRIFEPFFTTKPEGSGTGLGLSTSHGFVKDHGGSLTFECREGEYTRFHVDLPIA